MSGRAQAAASPALHPDVARTARTLAAVRREIEEKRERPILRGPFDLRPYQERRIRLVCGLCGFGIGTVVFESRDTFERVVDGEAVVAEVETVVLVQGGRDGGLESPLVESEPGDSARVDRRPAWFADVRERYRCPNRRCPFHRDPRIVLRGNLVRAFYEAAKAGRSTITLGGEV